MQQLFIKIYLSRICSSLFCKRAIVSLDFCNSVFNCIKSFFNRSFSSWSELVVCSWILIVGFVVNGKSDCNDAAGGKLVVCWWESGDGGIGPLFVTIRLRPFTPNGWTDAKKIKMTYRKTIKINAYIHLDLSKYMQDKAVDITALLFFFNSHEGKMKQTDIWYVMCLFLFVKENIDNRGWGEKKSNRL
jgi:hypothetical protein